MTVRGAIPIELHKKDSDATRCSGFVIGNRAQTEKVLIADVQSHQDYYAFGMQMPGRSYTGEGYRYGFNGKEKDKDWDKGGATYDYGFRIYDPRIGKFLSVDPLAASYPWYTPYQFAGNKPIAAIDLDGLEELIVVNKQSKEGGWEVAVKLNTTQMIRRNIDLAAVRQNILSDPKLMKKFIQGRGTYKKGVPTFGTLTLDIYSDGSKVIKYDPTRLDPVLGSGTWLYRNLMAWDDKLNYTTDPNSSGNSSNDLSELNEAFGSGYKDNAGATGKSDIEPGSSEDLPTTNPFYKKKEKVAYQDQNWYQYNVYENVEAMTPKNALTGEASDTILYRDLNTKQPLTEDQVEQRRIKK